MTTPQQTATILAVVRGESSNSVKPVWTWGEEQLAPFNVIQEGGIPGPCQFTTPSTGVNPDQEYLFTSALANHSYSSPWRYITQALAGSLNALGSDSLTIDNHRGRYRLPFRLPIMANSYILKHGVPVVAYNTREDFFRWSQSYRSHVFRKAYAGEEFSSESILAMNVTTIIAVAQEQKRVAEAGDMVHKDVFEVGAIFVPLMENMIYLYTASVTKEYLEALGTPDQPLKYSLHLTKTPFVITKEGEQFAQLVSMAVDLCGKINVLKPVVQYKGMETPPRRKVDQTRLVVPPPTSGPCATSTLEVLAPRASAMGHQP